MGHPNRSTRADDASERNPKPEEIREAREAARMTPKQAGELIYCTATRWQEWEAGTKRMHPAFWELWNAKLLRFR